MPHLLAGLPGVGRRPAPGPRGGQRRRVSPGTVGRSGCCHREGDRLVGLEQRLVFGEYVPDGRLGAVG